MKGLIPYTIEDSHFDDKVVHVFNVAGRTYIAPLGKIVGMGRDVGDNIEWIGDKAFWYIDTDKGEHITPFFCDWEVFIDRRTRYQRLLYILLG